MSVIKQDMIDHVIAYTVVEENVPAGYTSAVSGNQTDGFTVTNTISIQTKSRN